MTLKKTLKFTDYKKKQVEEHGGTFIMQTFY